jgi:hypothetical protein
MGLIVFNRVAHYDLKSYQTRSEAIRGESPLSSVQQGNFVANDPRWRSHLCRSINSISRRSLSSTHSHTHTTTHHTNHTHTHIHIHTQFLIRMSFSPSFVPPLSRRNLSSPLLSSLVYLRSDISIETISHRRNPTRRTAGPYTVPCDAIITRRDQRGYNIDQPDRLAKRKETRTDKGLLPEPRLFPYPLHSLSFPFALETLETIVASLSQQ